jgi:hypothetical protein
VGARLPGEWHFRYRGALRQKLFEQCDMFGRIDPVVAAGEHGHSAGAQARAMRGGVDAARESGHNSEARIAQIARNALGKLDPRRRRIPRADNADQRPRQRIDLAPHRKNRRRIVNHSQARGIVGLIKREKFDTRRLRSFQFGFGPLALANTRGTLQAAAARKIGQGHKGRMDTSIVPDKIMKGTRADVFAADQPEPIETRIFGLSRITQRLPPRFHPRQHYNRFLADTTISLARAFCLCADPAFGAAEQARDVFPVLDPQQ